MSEFGKWLMLSGVAIAVIGAVVWLIARSGFRGLPGDISYEGPSFRLYFPIVTCVVFSIALTLAVWLWRWFTQR